MLNYQGDAPPLYTCGPAGICRSLSKSPNRPNWMTQKNTNGIWMVSAKCARKMSELKKYFCLRAFEVEEMQTSSTSQISWPIGPQPNLPYRMSFSRCAILSTRPYVSIYGIVSSSMMFSTALQRIHRGNFWIHCGHVGIVRHWRHSVVFTKGMYRLKFDHRGSTVDRCVPHIRSGEHLQSEHFQNGMTRRGTMVRV